MSKEDCQPPKLTWEERIRYRSFWYQKKWQAFSSNNRFRKRDKKGG